MRMVWFAGVSDDKKREITRPCIAFLLSRQWSSSLQTNEEIAHLVRFFLGHLHDDQFTLQQALAVIRR